MKIAYFGGGSFRILPELREVLKHEIGQKLQVSLYDLNRQRGEAMAAIVKKSPEFAGTGAVIEYTDNLDKALDGADFVEMTACSWSGNAYGLSQRICNEYNWTCSDNTTVNGAFLAARGIPIVLDMARRLEKVSPTATMICFTNPIAVLTSAINRHTKIRAIGVCAGMQNHVHNISYMMKWPDYNFDMNAECAGMNHFSWIMSLELNGKDFLPEVDKAMRAGLDFKWLEQNGIHNWDYLKRQLDREVFCWKNFGAMLYSSEPDGLPHLAFYDEDVEMQRPRTPAPVSANTTLTRQANPVVEEFLKLASSEIPAEAWNTPSPAWKNNGYPGYMHMTHYKGNAPVRIMRGLMGHSEEALAASYYNNGAVKGFLDDVIMEYTCVFNKNGIGKKRTYTLPPATVGITQSLIEHQTLAADAIATENRQMFKQAIYAYPMCRSMSKVEPFFDRMVEANRAELPKFLQ